MIPPLAPWVFLTLAGVTPLLQQTEWLFWLMRVGGPWYLLYGRSIRITRGDPQADRERAHPAVRRHPGSGRAALFLNPVYTIRLDGMSEAESAPVLARLYAHMTRPEFCCRHRWRPGDLVIWINRMTLHFAVNDYDGHRRLL